MIRRRISAAVLAGMLLNGCSDDLDRERLRISDLDRKIGTISPIESVGGISTQVDSEKTASGSGKSSGEQVAAIEGIISGLSEGHERNISLAQARRATLANNLGLQSALILPQIASQQLLAEEAKFQATFDASVTAQRVVTPVPAAEIGLSNSTADMINLAPAVNVPLRTGGSIELDWTLSSQDTNFGDGSQLSSSSAPGLRLEQPLLRGAGIAYNEASIVIAEANLGGQRSQAQVDVTNQLVQAETAYWGLYQAWKMLQVNLGLYETAKDLLENQRRQTDLMNSSIANVYNFEVSLAVAAETVLASELGFRQAIRGLKIIIQDPEIELSSGLTLVPSTEPRLVGYDFDAEKLVQFAMKNRADLLDLEYQRIARSLEVLMRDNEILPELDLLGSWNANGFSTAYNSYRRANEDLFNEPDGWMVGVNLSVPLGNDVAIANLQAALLARLQSIADLRERRITVTAEVLDAIDALETGWDQILAARFQVGAAQRFYKAYKTLYERGEIPSSNLTQALEALSNAQMREIQTEVQYQIQFADLAQAVGCLMGHSGVDWASQIDLERLEKPAEYPPTRGITPESEVLDGPGPLLDSRSNGNEAKSMVEESAPASDEDDGPSSSASTPESD
ncbi:MAG: TolC family protein [Phycisphaera sp.]|nr:TolC family protein [Phycisphaera sp.]